MKKITAYIYFTLLIIGTIIISGCIIAEKPSSVEEVSKPFQNTTPQNKHETTNKINIFNILSIKGHKESISTDDFDYMDIMLRTSYNSTVDLKKLSITISNDTKKIENIKYSTNISSTYFNVLEIGNDVDKSFSTDSPLLNSGDRIIIRLDTSDLWLPPRNECKIEFISEDGYQVYEFVTANSYGADYQVELKYY